MRSAVKAPSKEAVEAAERCSDGLGLSSTTDDPAAIAAALEAFAAERIGYVGPSNPLGYRRLCKDHAAVDYRHAWACPDCLVELRERNRALVEALTLWLKALDSMRSFTVHDPRQHSVAEQFTEAERLARAALAADAKAGEAT